MPNDRILEDRHSGAAVITVSLKIKWSILRCTVSHTARLLPHWFGLCCNHIEVMDCAIFYCTYYFQPKLDSIILHLNSVKGHYRRWRNWFHESLSDVYVNFNDAVETEPKHTCDVVDGVQWMRALSSMAVNSQSFLLVTMGHFMWNTTLQSPYPLCALTVELARWKCQLMHVNSLTF